MTGRERLLHSFSDGIVDRPAVSPFIHENFIKELFADPSVDVLEATGGVYEQFGFDLMHRNIPSGSSRKSSTARRGVSLSRARRQGLKSVRPPRSPRPGEP